MGRARSFVLTCIRGAPPFCFFCRQINSVYGLVHPPEAEPSSPQPETNQLAATPLTDLAGTAEAAEAFMGQVRPRAAQRSEAVPSGGLFYGRTKCVKSSDLEGGRVLYSGRSEG